MSVMRGDMWRLYGDVSSETINSCTGCRGGAVSVLPGVVKLGSVHGGLRLLIQLVPVVLL